MLQVTQKELLLGEFSVLIMFFFVRVIMYGLLRLMMSNDRLPKGASIYAKGTRYIFGLDYVSLITLTIFIPSRAIMYWQ